MVAADHKLTRAITRYNAPTITHSGRIVVYLLTRVLCPFYPRPMPCQCVLCAYLCPTLYPRATTRELLPERYTLHLTPYTLPALHSTRLAARERSAVNNGR